MREYAERQERHLPGRYPEERMWCRCCRDWFWRAVVTAVNQQTNPVWCEECLSGKRGKREMVRPSAGVHPLTVDLQYHGEGYRG